MKKIEEGLSLVPKLLFHFISMTKLYRIATELSEWYCGFSSLRVLFYILYKNSFEMGTALYKIGINRLSETFVEFLV